MLTFAWRFYPYFLRLLPDGRYLVLNRDLQPLGWSSAPVDEHVAAQDHAAKFLLSKERLQAFADRGLVRAGCVFLYDDTTAPWLSPHALHVYLSRLGELALVELR